MGQFQHPAADRCRVALHPLSSLQQCSCLTSALVSSCPEYFGQPASQPSMDLQGLDLKAWLQLLINGKAGATPRRSGEWGQAMSQKCGAGCLQRCERHS